MRTRQHSRVEDATTRRRTQARAIGRWILHLAMAVALVSAAWVASTGNWEGTLRFAVVAVLMYLPRVSDVPPSFAGAFSALLLLATWASVEHWYRQITHFDVIVHVLTPGSLAAVSYFVLVHWRLMPPVSQPAQELRSCAPVVWVATVGVAAAVVWEFYEWVVEQVAPAGMRVGYTDTIVDLLAGMLGSVVAGFLVLRWGHRYEPSWRSARL